MPFGFSSASSVCFSPPGEPRVCEVRDPGTKTTTVGVFIWVVRLCSGAVVTAYLMKKEHLAMDSALLFFFSTQSCIS